MPETLPDWILTYALHSTFLGLVALGFAHRIRRADHRALALRMALFGALLSSTLPFQWTPAVTGLAAQRTAPAQASIVAPGVATGDLTLGTVEPALFDPGARAGAQGPSALGATGFLRAHWPSLAVALWLAVAAARLLQLERARRRFVRGLARVDMKDTGSRSRLDAWTAAEDRAPVRLSQSTRAASPLALSANEICVPASNWEQLSPVEREAALAHEFAHILRRDPLWFAAAAAIERVFWFLPLHGLLRRGAAAAAEVACDAAAARRVGSALAVARSLASVAAITTARPGSAPLPAMIPAMIPASATSKGELVTRVESLLRNPDLAGDGPPSPVGAKRFYVGVALSALAFACGAPNVGDGNSQTEAPTPRALPDDDMLVIDLHADGSATLHAPGADVAEISFSTKKGRPTLHAWLENAVADAPRGGPDSIDSANSVHDRVTSMPLLLRADEATPIKYAQWAMEACGHPDVQLWRILMQAKALPNTTYPVPLPMDLGISADPAGRPQHRVDIKVEVARNGSARIYTLGVQPHLGGAAGAVQPEVEEIEEVEEVDGPGETSRNKTLPVITTCGTLAEVRTTLRSLAEQSMLTAATIDPRKGTTTDDVYPLLDLLLEVDVQSISFMGSYEQ